MQREHLLLRWPRKTKPLEAHYARMELFDPPTTQPAPTRATWGSVEPGPQPCFAMRLGGVSGARVTQGCRDSSQTEIVGAGKLGSTKVPMATAT